MRLYYDTDYHALLKYLKYRPINIIESVMRGDSLSSKKCEYVRGCEYAILQQPILVGFNDMNNGNLPTIVVSISVPVALVVLPLPQNLKGQKKDDH